jgi:hypothetical protein
MYLYDIFLSIWCLLNCVMSSSLRNVCSTLWYLSTWTVFPTRIMSTHQYDVYSTVWSLLNCMMLASYLYTVLSSYLYDVSSTVGCLFTCVLSSYLYDVCLPTVYDIYSAIRCLPTYIDICSTAWCLPTCMISSHLYDVCSILYSNMSVLSKGCLPICAMFAQLRRKNLSFLWSCFLSRQTSKICQNNRPFRIFLILREKKLKTGDPCISHPVSRIIPYDISHVFCFMTWYKTKFCLL